MSEVSDIKDEIECNECKDCKGIITKREKIKEFIKIEKSSISEDEFKEYFSKWKYKLRLGKEVYISTEDSPRKLKKGEFITIKPGDFALLITEEEVKLDNTTMAFISMRFDYKQKGLINVSGFHVDPYFEGKLIFSAFNAGPRDILLRRGDPIFMIFFQKLGCPLPNDKKIKGYDYIPAEMVEQIRGKSATLASNATRLEKLEFYLKVIGSIVIAIFILLLGIIIKSALFPGTKIFE